VPNQPRPDNPARAVRINDALWAKLQARAAEHGTNVSAVIREALEKYVSGQGTP
jgi:plasmid stability protein